MAHAGQNHHEHHDTKEYETLLDTHDQWFRHDPTEPHHQEAHGSTSATKILAYLAAVIAFVGAVSLAIYHATLVEVNALEERSQEGRTPRAEYDSLRAAWDAQLRGFEWADPKAGTVRVPLDVAQQLVVAEYAQARSRTPGAGGAGGTGGATR